jgi:hypothetical protein
MEALARIQHGLFITNDKVRTNRNFCPPTNDPTIQAWKILSLQDYSPLHRHNFALATGRPLSSCMVTLDENDPHWEKVRSTMFAATDMLRYLQSENNGLVKTTVGLTLKAHDTPIGIYDTLNEIGVSYSFKMVKRDQKKQYAEAM